MKHNGRRSDDDEAAADLRHLEALRGTADGARQDAPSAGLGYAPVPGASVVPPPGPAARYSAAPYSAAPSPQPPAQAPATTPGYGRELFSGIDPLLVPAAGGWPVAPPATATLLASPGPSTPALFTGAGMAGGYRSATLLTAPAADPAVGEWVTCPECGERAVIDSAHRNAEDFCKRCDFPLFWARSAVIPMSGEETGASLRRLPGTVGRAATAALICPHCGEPNSPVAQICIRCALNLHPEPEPEPVPEPVYVAPPPPEPEPEKAFPLWWVIIMCACLVIITVLVAWAALA